MKVLIDVGHPKEVNIFKSVIWNLEGKGHTVKIFVRDKEHAKEILDSYGFECELGEHYKRFTKKAVGILKNNFKLYKISKRFKPHIFVGSFYTAQVSKLFRRPHIGIADTECATLALRLMLPFTNVVLAPSCFNRHIGPKLVRFNGYFELNYLHPNHFTPDPSVLEGLNLKESDNYILLRFSSLESHHDIGVKGFDFRSREEIKEFIRKIEDYGRIFLSSEQLMGRELEKYRLKVPVKDFHSFMSFSTLYMGDGASMAAEAAIMGTPSIYVSTSRRGYLDELEERYSLAYTITNREEAFAKAIELLEDKDLKKKWQEKREKMLSEKIDTTKFMAEFIENFVTTQEAPYL